MKKTILIIFLIILGALSFPQNSFALELPVHSFQDRFPEKDITQDERSLVIYPNPTNGIIKLTLKGFRGQKTEIQVMNVIGNVIHREVLNNLGEHYTKTVDLTKFASGLYYIKLQAENFSQIRKVIVN